MGDEAADPALASEIERLLNIIAPPLLRIELYAQPAAESRGDGKGLLARVAGQIDDCLCFWLVGMPDANASTCFLFRQLEVPGATLRVLHPASWVQAEDAAQLTAWSKLPEVVLARCEEPETYVALVTTAASEPASLVIDVSEMQEAICDSCLLGTWEADRGKFASFLGQAMNQNTAETGVEFVVSDVSSSLFLTFDEEHRMGISSWEFATSVAIPALNQNIAVAIEAEGTAEYSADGETLTGRNFDMTVTGSNEAGTSAIDITGSTAVLSLRLINLFGYGAQLGAGISQNASPQPLAYTCTEETLSYEVPDHGTVIWNRVEEIPLTPVPTPSG